jgi:hypothetical protein
LSGVVTETRFLVSKPGFCWTDQETRFPKQKPGFNDHTMLNTMSTLFPDGPAIPLFGGYWSSFVDHWAGYFGQQNGVIMAALGLGALSLLIITRGKWKK